MIREAFGLGLAFDNIDCSSHFDKPLSILDSVDPESSPVCSDYWTTRLGLRWTRKEKEKAVVLDPTPKFDSLVDCPRCGKEMFNFFRTEFGKGWLRSKGFLNST